MYGEILSVLPHYGDRVAIIEGLQNVAKCFEYKLISLLNLLWTLYVWCNMVPYQSNFRRILPDHPI